MNNKDLPAFPVEFDTHFHTKGLNTNEDICKRIEGLTKREIFAMSAMQGLLANYPSQQDMQNDPRYNGKNFAQVLAINSVEFADALLTELSKTENDLP